MATIDELSKHFWNMQIIFNKSDKAKSEAEFKAEVLEIAKMIKQYIDEQGGLPL